MAPSVLMHPDAESSADELLRPEPLADGTEPEQRLEIALTSGGVNKLEVYRQFKVPEVWIWRRSRLEIFVLGNSGTYEVSPNSRLLPGLDISLLERCVAIPSWQLARQTFRASVSKQ